MTFPSTRQSKLDPILADLKAIPGIAVVKQDDFDSNSIKVFVSPFTVGLYPPTFVRPTRQITADVRAAMKQADVVYNIGTPRMKYRKEYGETVKVGYDQRHIDLVIYV